MRSATLPPGLKPLPPGVTPSPPGPLPPTPELPSLVPGAPPPVTPGAAAANLALTKTAERTSATVGEIVPYTITARNTGGVAAYHVIVGDQPISDLQLVSANPTQGSCNEEVPLVCRLGTIEAGHSARITVRMRVTAPGTARNVAIIGSSASEARLSDNIAASATVHVHPRREPAACASVASDVIAHAAC